MPQQSARRPAAAAGAAPGRLAPGDELTSREREVIGLLARGDSNQEIARALGLSVRTIERHTANLYRKIDARGRADAIAYALRHRLADSSG